MEETLYIPVILATGRENNKTQHAARFMKAVLAADDGVETELIDASEFAWTHTTPPWQDESTQPPHHEQCARADGYVIVTPEYNHGYPGELKLLLDSMFDEYNDKPCGVCGVSAGGFGGARVIDHIKPVLIELGMVPLGRSMSFSRVGDLFDDDGVISEDHKEKTAEHAEKFKKDLVWYAKTLRYGREHITRA